MDCAVMGRHTAVMEKRSSPSARRSLQTTEDEAQMECGRQQQETMREAVALGRRASGEDAAQMQLGGVGEVLQATMMEVGQHEQSDYVRELGSYCQMTASASRSKERDRSRYLEKAFVAGSSLPAAMTSRYTAVTQHPLTLGHSAPYSFPVVYPRQVGQSSRAPGRVGGTGISVPIVPNIIIDPPHHSHCLTPPFSTASSSRWSLAQAGQGGVQKVRAYSDSAMHEMEKYVPYALSVYSATTAEESASQAASNYEKRVPSTESKMYTARDTTMTEQELRERNYNESFSVETTPERSFRDVFGSRQVSGLQRSEPVELLTSDPSSKSLWVRRHSDSNVSSDDSDSAARNERAEHCKQLSCSDTRIPRVGDLSEQRQSPSDTSASPGDAKSVWDKDAETFTHTNFKKYLQARWQKSEQEEQGQSVDADDVFSEPSPKSSSKTAIYFSDVSKTPSPTSHYSSSDAQISPTATLQATRLDDDGEPGAGCSSDRSRSELGHFYKGIATGRDEDLAESWKSPVQQEKEKKTGGDQTPLRYAMHREQTMFTFPINVEMFNQSVYQKSFPTSPLLHSPLSGPASTPPSPLVPSPRGIRNYGRHGSSVQPSTANLSRVLPPRTVFSDFGLFPKKSVDAPHSEYATKSPRREKYQYAAYSDYFEQATPSSSAPPSPVVSELPLSPGGHALSPRTPTSRAPQFIYHQPIRKPSELRGSHESKSTYHCPMCNLPLASYNALANHMVTHLPSVVIPTGGGAEGGTGEATSHIHLCKVCNKAFSRSDMLSRHMRLHTGLRPYECELCGQVFSRSDHLHTHQRTHTGEKPYRCVLCAYAAPRRDMVTRHMRVHNRDTPGRGRRSHSASSYRSATRDDKVRAPYSSAIAVPRAPPPSVVRKQKADLTLEASGRGGTSSPLEAASARSRNWSLTSSAASTDDSEFSPACGGRQRVGSSPRTWSTTSIESSDLLSPGYGLAGQLVMWSPSPDVFSVKQEKHFVWPSIEECHLKRDLQRRNEMSLRGAEAPREYLAKQESSGTAREGSEKSDDAVSMKDEPS